MRIVFMGTPEFAIPSLHMLVTEGYSIAAVITQPDKPKGRGNKLSSPPVKEFAQQHGIPVLQPHTIRTNEFYTELSKINPDLLITVAYGKILPPEVLNIPSLGCMNVHGSLLPKYRGAAPIQWSIINGETETGITTMFSDVGMDTGDMLLKKEMVISQNSTYGEVSEALSVIGAEVLKETLINLQNGTLQRIPQIDKDATMAPPIKKEDGIIDWNRSSKEIHNLIRGTSPSPGAYTFYMGERMKIWKTALIEEAEHAGDMKERSPGTIVTANKDGLVVNTGSKTLRIMDIQMHSSKRMFVGDYLRGHTINVGEILG